MKFGDKVHLESMRSTGMIRFSPISDFRECVHSERGDKLEGAVHVLNGQFSTIECNHPQLGKFSFKASPNSLGRISHYAGDNYCCFSSYALSDNTFAGTNIHKIDNRMLEFGGHVLVVEKPYIFLNSVVAALREKYIPYAVGLVSYIDLEGEGEYNIDLFKKRLELSHQFEHRILIESIACEPLYIEVGSMKEYSFIIESKTFLEGKFNAKRAG